MPGVSTRATAAPAGQSDVTCAGKRARPIHRAPTSTRSKSERTYFCCSAGFSAGFGGLVWFCCGLTGVLGFWPPEPEPGALVIGISFHEYLKNIFQVHFEAGACVAEYKGGRIFYLRSFFWLRRFTRRRWPYSQDERAHFLSVEPAIGHSPRAS
jgi:hypothetical protein